MARRTELDRVHTRIEFNSLWPTLQVQMARTDLYEEQQQQQRWFSFPTIILLVYEYLPTNQ